MNKIFSLDYQYSLYLERMNLKEDQLHPEQKKQLKQAFMGACAQFLDLLESKISILEETEAIKVLEYFEKQIAEFWLEEIKSFAAEAKKINTPIYDINKNSSHT